MIFQLFIRHTLVAPGVPEDTYRSPQRESRDSPGSPWAVPLVFECTPQGIPFRFGYPRESKRRKHLAGNFVDDSAPQISLR